MREILFRGKSAFSENWFEGDLRHFDRETLIIVPFGGEYCEVRPETVGQYTGLTDKNGKRIFEGDILDVSGSPDADLLGYRDGLAIVRWNEDVSGFAPFACYDSDCGLYVFEKECEVIGNVHDNPELIGGKEE